MFLKKYNKHFVIFADVPPYPNKKELKKYIKCGFDTYLFTEDHLSYFQNKDLYIEKIKLMEKMGLNIWIRGYNDNKSIPDYFDKFNDFDFNNYKNITGFYFVDEPIVDNLAGFKDKCVPFFNNGYSNLHWHINLLPSYTNNRSLSPLDSSEINPFEYYIQKYIEIVNMVDGEKDLGIDHYPLFYKNDKYYISDTWLYDMLIASTYSAKNNTKIANCVQAFSDIGWRDELTIREMQFLVSVQLAFGTSIFEFFLYNKIKDDDTWVPLSLDNKPTYVYYISKKVIRYLHKFEPYFKDLTWKGLSYVNGSTKDQTMNLLHIKDGSISEFDIPWDDENPSFKKIKDRVKPVDKINVTSNYDTLIGLFNNSDGFDSYLITPFTEPKLYLVNTINVDLFKHKEVELIINGHKKAINKNNKVTITLNAGDIALLSVK